MIIEYKGITMPDGRHGRSSGLAGTSGFFSFHWAMPPFVFATFLPLLRAAVFSAAL
jgi:hypothetical protein